MCFFFLIASHDASHFLAIAAMPKLLITCLEREDLKRRQVGIAEWQSRSCSRITLLKVRQVTRETLIVHRLAGNEQKENKKTKKNMPPPVVSC